MTESQATFRITNRNVQLFDFAEVTLLLPGQSGKNPFTTASLTGVCSSAEGPSRTIDGFCDAEDGSVWRIRFLAMEPGLHRYRIVYRDSDGKKHEHEGTFEAAASGRDGLLRADPQYPWHFVWSGTGRHFFYNGATTYWIAGWKDDGDIAAILDRLKTHRINRIRAGLSGRVESGEAWKEKIYSSEQFSFRLEPWVASDPSSLEKPGFDPSRFNLPFWRKWDRLLKMCRERGMSVSVIFYVDGYRPGTDPFGDTESEDELRYYRYAVSRLAAFSNITWDIANEYRLFRSDRWAHRMGSYLRSKDPYGHLVSIHGFPEYRFRGADWSDFALHQSWDEHGGNAFILECRRQQVESGKIVPQVNEEYGYEEHYPLPWGGNRLAPAREPDTRRRIAWEISMAGGYQTTGEYAIPFGGWISGKGDDKRTMMAGYGHMHDFFTSIDWWTLDPRNDLVKTYEGARFDVPYFTSGDDGKPASRTGKALCLCRQDELYVLYLPGGGVAELDLGEGPYSAVLFNPRTGDYASAQRAEGPLWKTPVLPDHLDWVFVLRKNR